MNYLAMPEQWRDIPGLEGCYQASSHGRIYSLPRHGTLGGIRKPYPSGKYGRLMVLISAGGKRKNCYVGALVARTWIGQRPAGQQVCHGPAGQNDCSPDNLYYGTPKRNQADRWRDGTEPAGEQNGRAKLTWELVGQIRQRALAGESQASLAREFEMGRTTIGMLVRGETWVIRTG